VPGRPPVVMHTYPVLDRSAVYFAGDMHFRDASAPGEDDRRTRFTTLLDSIASDCALILIGDLFDFYFEYRSVIPGRFLDILSAIRACSARGVDVHFIGGNHDYWVGPHFATALGLTRHDPEFRFECQGRRVACSHGDLVMPADRGYKALKSVLRNRAVIAATRWIHPDLLDAVAQRVSVGSRRMSRRRPEDRARELVDWAHATLFDGGNDVYVMGHVHHPVHDARDGRDFVIAGDWIGRASWARLEGGRIVLEQG